MPRILILAHNADDGHRWAEALSGLECRILRGPDAPDDPHQIDLVLTDADGSSSESEALGCWTPESIRAGLVGLVRIGGQGPADVRLPADATRRELLMACRLVAQIVRLRRALRERSENESRLLRQTLRDPLTGLPNRRAWDEALAERLQSSSRPGRRLAVAIFDLDHFKRVNDVHGHPAGDAVLRAAGEAIRGGLRQDDFVARLGGDEFGLLLWMPDDRAASAVLDRVRRQLPERLQQSELPPITASAGFWLAPDTPDAGSCSSEEPFESADAALREAKRSGRDRTVGG